MVRVRVGGVDGRHRVKIFAVSYCTPCRKARMFLEENSVEYEYVNIDEADPEERKEAMIEIGEYLPSRGTAIAYPIIIIDDLSAMIGFDRQKLSRILELQ